jgi:hypothetical protein
VGIRKALKAVSQIWLTATSEPEIIAEVPFATLPTQAVKDFWMGLVTRRASGVWFWWMNTEPKFCEVASRGPLDVFLKKIHKISRGGRWIVEDMSYECVCVCVERRRAEAVI